MWQGISQLQFRFLLFPGNGKVEYAEFEDMMASQIGEPMAMDDLKYYFKKFDQNGDGFISKDELALVMKTFGGNSYSQKEIDDMLAEADVNSDGKISNEGIFFVVLFRTLIQGWTRPKVWVAYPTMANAYSIPTIHRNSPLRSTRVSIDFN